MIYSPEALEKEWLEDKPFLLKWPLFSFSGVCILGCSPFTVMVTTRILDMFRFGDPKLNLYLPL